MSVTVVCGALDYTYDNAVSLKVIDGHLHLLDDSLGQVAIYPTGGWSYTYVGKAATVS